MSLVDQVKGFLRVFRFGKAPSYQHSGHALARTLKDAIHCRGSRGGFSPGTDRIEQLAAESAERYDQSFDD